MKAIISVLMFGAVALSGCTITARGYMPQPPPIRASVVVSNNGQQQQQPPPPQPQQQQVVQTSAGVQLGAGVQTIQASCVQGAPEQCNGLDDNCNGQIDEGCGYSSGNIQVTLSWNSGADLDIHVTDPMGQELNWQHTSVNSGGVLDQDARGACRSDQQVSNVENVFWNTPQPPRGNYNVSVDYFSQCGVAQATNAVVSISVGGTVVGTYSVILQPGQRNFGIAGFQL